MGRFGKEYDAAIFAQIDEALEANEIRLLDDNKKEQVSGYLGEPVIVDVIISREGSTCRIADKIKSNGVSILPSSLLDPTDPRNKGLMENGEDVKVVGVTPFSNGPLLVIHYFKPVQSEIVGPNRPKDKACVDAIDVRASDIFFGTKSNGQAKVKVMRMYPEALDKTPVVVGKSYRYKESDFGQTDSIEPLSYDTQGQVVEILLCTPPLSFPPVSHPWFEDMLQSGPLTLDTTFVQLDRSLRTTGDTPDIRLAKTAAYNKRLNMVNDYLRKYQQSLGR